MKTNLVNSIVLFFFCINSVFAVVYSDDFNSYSDTTLGTTPETSGVWIRRGDKNVFAVSSGTGTISPEVTGGDAPCANWYNATSYTKQYQKISMEFTPGSGATGHNGSIKVTLNQDWGNSGYYCSDTGYYLLVRGVNDMWMGRATVAGGWGGAQPGYTYYCSFVTPLDGNSWYRLILIRDGRYFTGRIETLAGVVVGQVSYYETVEGLMGGYPGIVAMYSTGVVGPYGADNFAYEVLSESPDPNAPPVEYPVEPVIYYDPVGQTMKPFYPIGWYTYGPAGGDLRWLDEIAANGANCVLYSDVLDASDWHFGYVSMGLDRAEQLGIKIIVGFSRDMLLGVDYNVPSTFSHLERWITTYKDHPALLGWQLGDENGGALTAEMVRDSARAIRDWDPYNPIWQVFEIHRETLSLIAYMDHTDVVSFDFYQYFDTLDGTYYTPPFGGSDGLLNMQCQKLPIVSENGWAGNLNVTQAIGADLGTGIDIFRFPTYDEYRWNVFSAIAGAHARGTMNWIYYYGVNYYSDPEMFFDFRDLTVRPVNLEQQELAHALETGWNVGTVTSNLDIPVPGLFFNQASHILLYDDEKNSYYLIVMNNTYDSQTIELTLADLPVPLRHLSALNTKDQTVITMEDLGSGWYQLTDTLANHEVKIYTLSYSCSESLDFLRADINYDCYVNMYDLVLINQQWLNCNDPDNSSCL